MNLIDASFSIDQSIDCNRKQIILSTLPSFLILLNSTQQTLAIIPINAIRHQPQIPNAMQYKIQNQQTSHTTDLYNCPLHLPIPKKLFFLLNPAPEVGLSNFIAPAESIAKSNSFTRSRTD